MSAQVMGWVLDGGPEDTVQRYVMVAIADHADNRGISYPGIALLAAKTCQSERNIYRVLKALEEMGWLQVRRRCGMTETPRGPERRGNIYCLNVERLRARAEIFRTAWEKQKVTWKLDDTLSPRPFIWPSESATYEVPHDTVSPTVLESVCAQAEVVAIDEETVENLWKGCGKVQKEEVGEVTNAEARPDKRGGRELTNTPPRPDKSAFPLMNHEPSTEPRTEPRTNNSPPTPPPGVEDESSLGGRWSKFLTALKTDLADSPSRMAGGRFSEVVPGQNDFDTCFRDWWLVGLTRDSGVLARVVLETEAADPRATELGLEKYRARLAGLVRVFFEIPQDVPVRFWLKPATPANPAKRLLSLLLLAMLALSWGRRASAQTVPPPVPPAGPQTWFVRPDGGTRSQCTGLVDAAYPGSGSAQPCALGDYRSLYDGGVYAQLKWIIAGGDTVILDNTKAWRVGFDQSSPSDPWCPGGGANPYGCFNPPIPAGTPAAHTRILGRNFAGCSTAANQPDPAKLTQIFGGHGISAALNLDATAYVDVECLELTSHASCIVHGVDAPGVKGPARCQTGYPIDDYDSSGIITDAGTHDILLQDVWVHGHTDRGIKGPIGGTVTANRVDISTNGMAGWDFDDGNGTPSVNATLNLLSSTIEFSGCNQTWPSPLPTSCYSQSTGGYGDGIGTPAGMGMNVNIDHTTFRYNTQDGEDFGHIDTGASTLSITNSQSYGNNGGQFKWGPAFSRVTFVNNLAVANCDRMREPLPGIPASYNASLADFCRANDALSFNFYQNATALFDHNTLITAAPTAYDAICSLDAPASCSGVVFTFTNNITLGLKSRYENYGGNAGPGGFCGAGCNGTPLPIGTFNRANNVFWGLGSCPANQPQLSATAGTATGESCVDPRFVGEPANAVPESALDAPDWVPAAGSPAAGLGYNAAGIAGTPVIPPVVPPVATPPVVPVVPVTPPATPVAQPKCTVLSTTTLGNGTVITQTACVPSA